MLCYQEARYNILVKIPNSLVCLNKGGLKLEVGITESKGSQFICKSPLIPLLNSKKEASYLGKNMRLRTIFFHKRMYKIEKQIIRLSGQIHLEHNRTQDFAELSNVFPILHNKISSKYLKSSTITKRDFRENLLLCTRKRMPSLEINISSCKKVVPDEKTLASCEVETF